MLNQVPGAINQLSARIIHRHPNSIGCQLFRKRVTRIEPEVIGGLGVLSSEDEEEIEFDFLGPGSALPIAEDGGQPSIMNDNQDVPYGAGDEFRFLIAPEATDSADQEWFAPEKSDILLLWLMDDGSLKIPFEVVNIETVNNLPPFSVRYVCNRRDDLLWAMNDLDDPTPPDDADPVP